MENNYQPKSSFLSALTVLMILISLLSSGSRISAQEFAIDLGKTATDSEVSKDDMNGLRVTFSYPGIQTYGIKSEQGLFNEIFVPNAYWIGELGTPKLPATKHLIEIPFGASVSVKVLNYTVQEFKLKDHGIENLIMPVQPSLRKDQDVDEVPFEFRKESYEKDEFIRQELAQVEVLGVMRSYRIARLTIAPVEYNPVKGMIRVYNDIEVEVSFDGADAAHTDYIKAATWSPYFEMVRNNLLNNPSKSYPAHPDLTTYPIKYLIVSPRMFETDLQPFIEWKTMKGFEVITGYTDVIGATYSAIQNWIHAQYNAGTPENPAPSFLLIVGDTPQIPAITGSSSGKMTDLYYASVDGDMFLEMYYGRFSATNSAQLQAQIEKTIFYEKYEFTDPSFLDKSTLIAGADGTWNPRVGQPTIHYATNNYFNASHGYTDVYTYLTSPYTGCYNPDRIAVGFINYTAHCSQTSWGDPLLTQTNVNNFTNTGKFPLAIGNCCLAADFGYAECIGETWQRAANKGSVAYIGSSPNSYWFEDFYWSVGAFPIQGTNNGYVPTFAETTWGAYDGPFVSDYVSTGGIVMVGNLAVTEVHIQGYPSHSSPLYYWQAYNVLGDPSLVAYHTQGSSNMVSHMPILPIGMNTYEVSALPGSYVAVSKDGILHGAALVGPLGVVQVPIEPVTGSGTVTIVVTKPQHIPYIEEIPAAALEGPFLVLDYFEINDIGGNNNSLADYGEDISLDVAIKNVGADPSGSVSATLTGSDPYVSLVGTATQNFGVISNGESATINDAYFLSIADNAPDQYLASFTLEMEDDNGNWASTLHITVQAPDLHLGSLIINDVAGGNGNGRLDPGETVDIIVEVLNTGHSLSPGGNAVLTTDSPWISILDGADIMNPLGSGNQSTVQFTVSVSPSAPIGLSIALNVSLEAGNYFSDKVYHPVIGLILEDWETGNFSLYPWTFGGNAPWVISTENPYEGVYCVKSGAIAHNQTSDLTVELYVGENGNISFFRMVSSESGYDYLRFFIDGVQQAQWSGEVAWSEVSFPVEAGLRTFTWRYYKDGSVSSGSDCAWIDYIVFPPIIPPPDPPQISFAPGSYNLTLEPGGSTQQNLTIENVGDQTLNFTAQVIYSPGSKNNATVFPEPAAYNTGSTTNTAFTQNSQVKAVPPGEAGWMKFDVSSIPVGSVINSVYFHGYVYETNWPYWSITPVTNDPLTSTPSALYNDIIAEASDGYYLFRNESSAFTTGWKEYLLVGNVNSDLESALAQGWFTIGIVDRDNSSAYHIRFDGWAEANKPYLVIDYTYIPSVTWLGLDGENSVSGSINAGNFRNIEVSFEADGLEEGEYFANIAIYSNDPVTPVAFIPCTLTVAEALIPENLTITDVIDDGGCFNAYNTVTIEEATFMPGVIAEVRSGNTISVSDMVMLEDAELLLIASTSISMNHEIIITPGANGLFLAKISEFEHCILQEALLTAETIIIEELTEARSHGMNFFRIYPNPTTSTFKLELLNIEDAMINIEIYGMMGERVFQDVLFGAMQYEFDLSNMPRGIYFIRVLKGDEMGIEKVIRQ